MYGKEKLEAKNWELRSLVHLTIHCAKAKREHKEELEDSLVRMQLSRRRRQERIVFLRHHKNQYKANLERSQEEADSQWLKAALQSEARDNL